MIIKLLDKNEYDKILEITSDIKTREYCLFKLNIQTDFTFDLVKQQAFYKQFRYSESLKSYSFEASSRIDKSVTLGIHLLEKDSLVNILACLSNLRYEIKNNFTNTDENYNKALSYICSDPHISLLITSESVSIKDLESCLFKTLYYSLLQFHSSYLTPSSTSLISHAELLSQCLGYDTFLDSVINFNSFISLNSTSDIDRQQLSVYLNAIDLNKCTLDQVLLIFYNKHLLRSDFNFSGSEYCWSSFNDIPLEYLDLKMPFNCCSFRDMFTFISNSNNLTDPKYYISYPDSYSFADSLLFSLLRIQFLINSNDLEGALNILNNQLDRFKDSIYRPGLLVLLVYLSERLKKIDLILNLDYSDCFFKLYFSCKECWEKKQAKLVINFRKFLAYSFVSTLFIK
jgi:hypothetical protein